MASALVQMTAFSPCSQLSDMIMIGMEASLESFPGSRDEGNKRSHSDGDEDQDRSHVKKRRKQSKPIRITANDSLLDSKVVIESGNPGISDLDFSETGEHFLTEGLIGVNAGSKTEEYGNRDHKNQQQLNKMFYENQDKRSQDEKTYDSSLPLNLSNLKHSFMDSMVTSEVGDSQATTNEHVPVDNNMQFQSTTHDGTKPVAQENYLSQSPSLLLPLFKQNQIQNQISQITSQMRIFNPEAFCDLCNKEFCNKYFLKTHKANKHGIYTESPSGPTLLDPMPSIPFTNYFSTSNDTYENPSSFQSINISKNLFCQSNYVRIAPKKNHALQQQQQQQQPQNSAYSSLKSNSSGSMRALCNICQREFCNKYFVRRHKLKIHGIVDPVSKDGSIADTQESNSLNNSSQDKVDMPNIEAEVHSGYVKQFIPSNFNIEMKEVSPNVEPNLEKPKEKTEKEPEHDTQLPQASHLLPTTIESGPVLNISQNEDNNKENALSSVRLKKFGVVNADAFCDICCKEYCNKYFLRTHKLKSHGIIPVDEKKDDTVNGTSSNMSWYQMQTTPLNLIVNEPSVPKDASEKVCFELEGEECVCNVCGRYFQSQFLLKMHQAYIHPNKFMTNEVLPLPKQNTKQFDVIKGKDFGDVDLSQKQFLESYLPVVKTEYSKEIEECENKAVVNTENLQKLQTLISRLNGSNNGESSTCDVCDKDVGHVSLLENHILKEHAVLLEEMGNITEEENSSSQSSLVSPSLSFKKECPHCQKIFLKPFLLEQHMNDIHGDSDIPVDPETLKALSESKEINDTLKTSPISFAAQSSEDRQGLQTPTSSFCEICKKELCNKYFMKTHMQRMHGISIENGAQIGGVVCDICNKELCSKYFLRVHKQNSHGIVDELFLPQLGLDFVRNADPALKPMDHTDLTNRYFTHFNEVCTICNRRFRSVKWLKAHLWNDHGEEGKEKLKESFIPQNLESKITFEDISKDPGKQQFEFASCGTSNQSNTRPNENMQNGKDDSDSPSIVDKNILNNTTMFSMIMNGKDSESKYYQCSYCSFTTKILAFLFIHERSHMNTRSFPSKLDNPVQCPISYQKMDAKDQSEKHMKAHFMTSSSQQPFSLNNSSQEISITTGQKADAKKDVVINKEMVLHPDQEYQENLNFPSHYGSQSKPNLLDSQPDQSTESSVKCTKCGFNTNNVQVYLDHVNREHPFLQMDQEHPSYLQQVEKALSTIACSAGIPAVFAVPRTQDQVIMQPFVIEESENISGTNNSFDPTKPGKTFLSSLVFLPVKEKLKKSVTASFKLTPT